MLSIAVVIFGLLLSIAIMVGAMRVPINWVRGVAGIAALIVLFVSVLLASVRHIGSDEVGIVVKNVGGKSLEGGALIAVNGEQGVQAEVLSPGWHFWYWPGVYTIREVPLVEVKANQVGLIETTDGKPLDPGQIFAPEWTQAEFGSMQDAGYFLSSSKGRKGAQASVLTTGKYRLNTELFKVRTVPVTEVLQGEVAVLKANFGQSPTIKIAGFSGASQIDKEVGSAGEEQTLLAGPGEMGIRAEALPPGKYPVNTEAYTVVELWTTQMISHYTAMGARNATSKPPGKTPEIEEREIKVRTSDGFTFPVDVRVEYRIEPRNAAVVVAKLGDDEGDRFQNALNSAVRAIFRNNAEKVKALDYVQQRSHQEEQSARMLADQMARYGVTVTAVRIGDVGDEQTLGSLLKTQTDRELAKQELITFQEQQKTAEEQKRLNKAKQESEEERKLATAAYGAKIAQEAAKQKVTEAEAEAQALTVRAKAQADAYQIISLQIGKSNAAMLEMLKIVGERGIQIAPRVMVIGGERSGSHSDGETVALIGTMLDSLVDREEQSERQSTPAKTVKGQP